MPDFKPMVDFMKDCFEKYGLWQMALFLVVILTFWHLPELIESVSKLLVVMN